MKPKETVTLLEYDRQKKFFLANIDQMATWWRPTSPPPSAVSTTAGVDVIRAATKEAKAWVEAMCLNGGCSREETLKLFWEAMAKQTDVMNKVRLTGRVVRAGGGGE